MINGQGGFVGLVNSLLNIINTILPVLAAAAMVLFMWGAVKYIINRGGKGDRKTMLWSLVALFVLFSFWGIIRVAQNSLLAPGENSTGVNNYFGSSNYQNNLPYGGPR